MASDEDEELERVIMERLQTPEEEFIVMTFEELEKFNATGESKMTQWNIGDRAEVIVAHDGHEVGRIGVVVGLDHVSAPIFDIDRDKTNGWLRADQFFRRFTSPDYETITINGKLYNLVPVEA